MHNPRLAALLLGVSASSSVISSQAIAQSGRPSPDQPASTLPQAQSSETSADSSGPTSPDIVVTAQKRSESINKVGISITALTGDSLVQKGIVSTNDLVKVVPGFNFTQSSYGAPVYTLRGIGFYDTSLGSSPTVSVYVDEVPLPYSVLTVGAGLDVQRVEVLKGPQGTLFGQNATGGAVNYVAAKPTSKFTAGGDLSYGRFNSVDARAFVSGPLTDTLRARLAVSYTREDPWQRSYTRNDSLGRANVLVGRLLLDWTPVEHLRLEANVNGWRDRSDNQAGQLIAITNLPSRLPPALVAYPLAPRSNRAADWDPNARFRRDNDFYQMSLRGDYDFDFATLTSISSYQHLNRDGATDADGTAIRNFTIAVPGGLHVFSQELRLAGDLAKLHWLLGGNYQSEDIDDSVVASYPDSSLPIDGASPRTNQRVKTWAAFGNLEYEVVPGVKLQGGLRYTDQHRRFAGCTYDDGSGQLAALLGGVATRAQGRPVVIPPGGCTTLSSSFVPEVYVAKLDENSVSWRAGANWQIDPQTLVYANVSRGYKNGAFPTIGASFSVAYQPAVQESVLAYEIGAKVGLLDRTLQLNGALFYYDYSDKQFRGKRVDEVVGPLNALINIPKSRVQGAELQAAWTPDRAFSANVGVSYVDSKIKNFSNFNPLGQTQDFSGERFPLAPKWQVNSDVEYRVPVSATLDGFIGGNLSYQSATNAGLGDLNLLRVRGYTTADARIGVRANGGRWNANLFVRNLGDTYYWSYVSTTSPDVAVRLAGRPRTFGVALGFRY